MFSEDDILDIYSFLPPEKQKGIGKSDGLPLLIRTISGRDFVTERSLRQKFDSLMESPARVSLSNASSQLDVDIHVIKQLVRVNPTLAMLDHSQCNIIARHELYDIARHLEEQLAKEAVSKYDFAQRYNLGTENLESLLQVLSIKESLVDDTKDYLLGGTYFVALTDTISGKLAHEVEGLEAVILESRSLPGAPPVWLIQKCLGLLRKGNVDLLSHFYIEDKAEAIHCTPKKLILTRRDKILSELQAGKRFTFPLEDFLQTFRELYQSSEALEEHLSKLPSITIVRGFAVSENWLSNHADAGAHRIDDQGYVHLETLLPPEAPRAILDDVRNLIAQKILTAASSDDKPLRHNGDYVLTEATYDVQRQALSGVARAQASRQWELLKEAPDKDPKFQLAEAIASIPDDERLLRFLAPQKEFEIVAAEQFTATISELESQNENNFSTFWMERVSLRVQNYIESLKSVEDAKVQEQLSELVSDYLQNKFLPDMVSKARSQGLVCSRKTRKNVNRFEVTLKTGNTDLFNIISILNKFTKKQGLPEIDANAAVEAKKALIQDMVRRMQKPKTDAPLMFLSLVVILFAIHHPGVVYATGKFAPKLLKQLKGKLSGEEYEQVEKWKALAKTGTLPKEDREAMVQKAEQASS